MLKDLVLKHFGQLEAMEGAIRQHRAALQRALASPDERSISEINRSARALQDASWRACRAIASGKETPAPSFATARPLAALTLGAFDQA